MSAQTEELKARVEAKKKIIEAEIAQLKADAKGAKNQQVEKLEKKLGELHSALEKGWDNVTDGMAKKLNSWLS